MKSRRTASSAGVPKVLSERIRRSSSPRRARLDVGRVRAPAEGRDLDELAAVEEDVGEAEATADDAAVAEDTGVGTGVVKARFG